MRKVFSKLSYLATLTYLASCGDHPAEAVFATFAQEIGYTQIMAAARQTEIKALMPNISDFRLQMAIKSQKTMWYDAASIVPGYQDSMSDPEGMRPNSIEPILIDLAVPGGHGQLFAFEGRFNFPFGTGGADRSENLVKVNFWLAPQINGKTQPVVYWRLPFSRWRWLFPRGTILGEVLLVKYPSGAERVFEVRVRERNITGWTNKVFRPYLRPEELVTAIKDRRPAWRNSFSLRQIVSHLEGNLGLQNYVLRNTRFSGALDDISGSLDIIPDFSDEALAKDLLSRQVFRLANNINWKSNGSQLSFAASTNGLNGIVPQNYEGGMLEISDTACRRCHDQAGRQIGDFYPDLVAYGEIWGEDETFSWHPFENSAFVLPNGRVNNFNNDNRRIRADFVRAGLVESYNASSHSVSIYQELPRDWSYRPIMAQ